MRNLFKNTIFILTVIWATACTTKEEVTPTSQIDITQITGTWNLVSYYSESSSEFNGTKTSSINKGIEVDGTMKLIDPDSLYTDYHTLKVESSVSNLPTNQILDLSGTKSSGKWRVKGDSLITENIVTNTQALSLGNSALIKVLTENELVLYTESARTVEVREGLQMKITAILEVKFTK